MRKTFKTAIVVALVLLLTLSFAACGGGGAKSDQIELTVLNYFSLANPGAINEVNRVWEVFERDNPDIKIIREDEFEEPFHHKTEAYAAAGQLPDVIHCWPSGRSTSLHTQRLLKDLAPLVQRDGLAQYFSAVSLDPSQQGAGYLGMITRGMTATNAFFVNMEVLRDCGLQPAKTYSELKAQVPILRAKGYECIIMPNESTWVMQSCLFSSIAGRFMGEGWDKKVHSGQAKFTDPDFVAALNFVKTMYDDGVLLRSSIAMDYGAGPGLFATNKGAYYIDGDWRVGDFTQGDQPLFSPDRQKDVLITVFPDIDLPGVKINKTNTVVLATGWGINANIPAGSAKEEAAWRLVKWLTGKEVQSFFVENGTFATPSRTDIDLASLPLVPLQVTVAKLGNEYNISTVVIDAAFEGPVYTPLNDGLQAIGMGTQTPQQVAAATQAAFETWKATQ
ncbi:MAG: extracellular solute-binding protein [Treponema sp.]|nr:extracellular solute-binding protein [Treponema sp.]